MSAVVNIIFHVLFSLCLFCYCKAVDQPRPHIFFILADDLGWNDVGFHGSSEIPTPNIDALAYSGLLLQNYYVTPICTPSRSALMTGKYPIHTGMQHTVLYAAEPRGLPLSERILPQYLQDLGYSTHIVGKWHLGHYRREYTPLYRGFESHLGFWTGHHDYYDHTAVEKNNWGIDMRRGMDVAWDLHGQYSTNIFSKEAVRLVEHHNTSKPLFLYIAHAAVHSSNPYSPLPAPDDVVARFSHIEDFNRRKFAGMLTKLDDSVGELVDALSRKDMLKNSIIIFSTDNGGPAEGFNLNAASNWPLRGVKNTLFEGGVRGAGLLWSPRLQKPQRVSSQMMHISDWLPTLISAAGGNHTCLKNLDGIDMWKSLSQDTQSPRTRLLHNIDDVYGNAAVTDGNWKLLRGNTYNGQWDGWYGPAGRNGSYDIGQVLGSKTGRALRTLGLAPDAQKIRDLRKSANIKCSSPESALSCNLLKAPCLFNVQDDPCELNNLADGNPAIVTRLLNLLHEYNSTVVPPRNLHDDPRADPRFWDYSWTNFGDHSLISNAV